MVPSLSIERPVYTLFGGTFDPLHNGHLALVAKLVNEIGVPQIALLPNHIPPHRPQPEASPLQRLTMLQLAVAHYPFLCIDTRELQRNSPSVTLETLKAIRHEKGEDLSLIFIIGADILHQLHTWKHWQTLLHYCHFVVCPRPGYTDPIQEKTVNTWVNKHLTTEIMTLRKTPHGAIYQAHTPLSTISATEIRRKLHTGEDCSTLLPQAVLTYILQTGLYR